MSRVPAHDVRSIPACEQAPIQDDTAKQNYENCAEKMAFSGFNICFSALRLGGGWREGVAAQAGTLQITHRAALLLLLDGESENAHSARRSRHRLGSQPAQRGCHPDSAFPGRAARDHWRGARTLVRRGVAWANRYWDLRVRFGIAHVPAG